MSQARRPNKRRRPITFREALSQTMPLAPSSADVAGSAMKMLLVVLWVLAAIALGVGLGLLLVHHEGPTAQVTPYPVASIELAVTGLTNQPSIEAALPVEQPTLTLSASSDVAQAQAGSPFKVGSALLLQPAPQNAELQPGFAAYQNLQGNVGTDPISSR